jgi:dolichyl-phosphate-mannose-protein mannosyltransferase
LIALADAERLVFSKEWVLLAVIVLILLAVRLTFIHEPFERDEGGYAYIGQEILRGAVPYRDVIDLKPPGTYYYYACAEAVAGQTVEGIRAFTAGYAVLTLLATYYAARKFGSRPGLLAALLYALFSGAPRIHGSGCNSEVIMLLPLMIGLCFLMEGMARERRAFIAAAGFCSASALLTKTVSLPYDLVFLVIALCSGRRSGGGKGMALNAAAFIAPQILLAGAVLAWFSSSGALADYVRWNVTIPLSYVKNSQFVGGVSFFGAVSHVLPALILPFALAFGTSLRLLATDRSPRNMLAILLLPAACVGVWMPGKWFPHYFIQLVPFCSVLGGIGLAALLQAKGWARNAALLVCAAAFVNFAALESVYFRMDARDVPTLKFQDDMFASSIETAGYIRERTTPDDYILQWGFEPEIYFLSGRRAAIPYVSAPVLALEPDIGAAVTRMLDSLRQHRPRYVLIQDNLLPYPGSEEIFALLDAEYHEEARLRYMYVFRRN